MKNLRAKKFGFVFVVFVLVSTFVFSLSVFAVDPALNAPSLLSSVPSTGHLFTSRGTGNFFLRATVSDAGSIFGMTSTQTHANGQFADFSIMSVYDYDELIYLRCGFVYSFVIDYYINYGLVTDPVSSDYDLSTTELIFFNDTGVFADDSQISYANVFSNSSGHFLPDSIEWVSDHYELTYNCYIDPETTFVGVTPVTHPSLDGVTYIPFWSWAVLTPHGDFSNAVSVGSSNSTIVFRTVLQSAKCIGCTPDEFLVKSIQGSVGEISKQINHIYYDPLPSASPYSGVLEIGQAESVIHGGLEELTEDVVLTFPYNTSAFSEINVGTAQVVSNYLQHLFERNSYIHMISVAVLGSLLVVTLFREVF